MATLRIGTRGSPLALWQARHVAHLLSQAWPDLKVELVPIQTVGDQVRNVPLAQIGGEGVFTKALQDALLESRVDVAVHSLKDLPTIPVAGLVLAAVPQRGPVGDVFLSHVVAGFDALPHGAKLATGSLRRRAQVLHRRPDLQLVDIRGNVETRLKKLEEGDLAGLILAEAGLVRLGLATRIKEVLDASWLLPAVGQGALGLECRSGDDETRRLLTRLDDAATHATVLAERSLLSHLGGGCQVPLGVCSKVNDKSLWLRGAVLPPDGKERVEGELTGTTEQPEEIGRQLADNLIAKGADRLLRVK